MSKPMEMSMNTTCTAMDFEEIPELVEIENKSKNIKVNPGNLSDFKVPITILTGFLGAGKSTLLNEILTRKDLNRRFAVIMNEFGDTAEIEKAVSIQKAGGDAAEEWLELPNGCLCCTIKTTALQAIESLLIRKQGQIDYILLETTGLADPYPIINSFWADEALECRSYLDGIVCLVDAKNIEKLLTEFGVLMQQIVLADVLLINKIDLVDEIVLENLKDKLKEINPLAKIIESKYGKVVVELGAIDSDNVNNFDIAKILDMKAYGKIDCTFVDNKNGYLNLMSSLDINRSSHHSQVRSIKICTMRAVDRENFEKWLFGVLWSEKGAVCSKILRTKGLIRIRDGNDILVQAVQDLYELTEITNMNTFNSNSGTITSNNFNKNSNRESILVMLGSFSANDESILRDSFHSSVY